MSSLSELGFTKQITMLASALRSASANSAEFTNDGHRGVRLFLDITAEDGTVTLDVKLQVKDHVSGKWIDLPGAAFAQKSGTGHSVLTVYPGIAETANESVSDVLGKSFRAVATLGGTTSMTFSLAAELIP